MNAKTAIDLGETPQELPDIHWMEVNPTKRAIQRYLLRRIFESSTRKRGLEVLCLPGKSGWDIDYFLSRKEVSRVVGVERDPTISEGLLQRYSPQDRVEIVTEDLTTFLASTSDQFDLAYLDYCSPLTLAVGQDVELLTKRILRPHSRCLIGIFNAREGSSTQMFHRRLFEEVDRTLPSGESWEEIEPNRRRCIAFNALLLRQRLPHRGRQPVNVVHGWHTYPSLGGSMLTGYFTRSRGLASKSHIHLRNVDRWYVRGAHALLAAAKPKSIGGLARESTSMGRDLRHQIIRRQIVEFYRDNGYPPPKRVAKKRGWKVSNSWNSTIRDLGLCPNFKPTVDDIKGEVRRIHERDGTVTTAALKRARLISSHNRLPTRRSMRDAYGETPKAFPTLLEEMGLPYDLRTPHVRKFHGQLKEWVEHLEEGAVRKKFPHYDRMRDRGLHKYEDAIKELRRLQKGTKS